MTFKA